MSQRGIFLFSRALTWREWLQWVLENQPERMGFAPHGRPLRQPQPQRIPEDRADNPENMRDGAR